MKSNNTYIICVLSCFLSLAGIAYGQKKDGGLVEHDNPPQREYTQKDLNTDAKTLWENLTNNTIQLPFGTDLEITGVIVDKGISRYLTAYIALSEKKKGDQYVICVLPGRGDILNLKGFTEGETITMRGKYYATRSQIVVKQCKRVTEEKEEKKEN